MEKINKENLSSFFAYYHGFHDSTLIDVNYDFKKAQLNLFIDVFWSGETILEKNGTWKPNKKKIKLICNGILQYNFKEIYSDYIDEACLKYIKRKNKEFIFFATDIENPLISVICTSISYEELEDN